MTIIRSSCFQRLGCMGKPLELWLHALCMGRDIAVSSLIFWTLAPWTFLSALSEVVCPGWSFHHLLIYRQPGHTTRENVDVVHGMDLEGSDREYASDEAVQLTGVR